MHRQLYLFVVTSTCVALSACVTVGPDYEPPEVVVNDQWHQAIVTNLEAADPGAAWWQALNDPLLNDLVQRAQVSNLSLRAAVARVDEAARFLGIARGGRYPDVGAVGAYSVGDSPLDVVSDVGTADERGIVSARATWELDFWGRVRRTIESSEASYEATVEAYRDVLVLLNAEVASNYILLRTQQERLRLAKANVERQRETLRLTDARNRAELAPDIDVEQARLNLATTESAVPALESAIRQAINNLSVLLGEQPGELAAELATPRPLPEPPATLAAGIPADAIRNRPDVRRAERQLAAQTARIGIATTALYPNFFLNGNFGYITLDSGSQNDSGTIWSAGPVFSWNLFDGGRVRNNIGVQEARTEQALAAYESSVLEALRDTENSLVAYAYEQERMMALNRSVDAAAVSADLVISLYRSGLTNFQNVLDIERSLFNQQDLSAVSKGEVLQNVISVYRATGGGWSAEIPAAANGDE